MGIDGKEARTRKGPRKVLSGHSFVVSERLRRAVFLKRNNDVLDSSIGYRTFDSKEE